MFLSFSLAAAFCGLLWGELWPGEPSYEGKSITYWINHPHTERPFESFGEKQFYPEEVKFPKVDDAALPYLVKALNQRDGRLYRAYRTNFYELPTGLQRLLPAPKPSSNELIRLVAIEVLNRMGKAAKPAIPELIRVSKSDDSEFVRSFAVDLLGHFAKGDKAVYEALEQALKDEDEVVRDVAADALKQD